MVDKLEGLIQAVMARLNQSTEALVYCILGVDVRASILGDHQELGMRPSVSSSC